MILACPLTFGFLRLFCLFGFLTAFHRFLLLLLKFPLASSLGCDPNLDFHEKKIIQTQRKTTGGIFILECDRNSKNNIFSFQAQTIKINKL